MGSKLTEYAMIRKLYDWVLRLAEYRGILSVRGEA